MKIDCRFSRGSEVVSEKTDPLSDPVNLKDFNKLTQKMSTIAKSFLSLRKESISESEGIFFKRIKLLNCIEIPNYFIEVFKAKTLWDIAKALKEVYFYFLDLREGISTIFRLQLVPAWESKVAAVIKLTAIITFTEDLQNFWKTHSTKKLWLSSCSTASSLTIGASEFAPDSYKAPLRFGHHSFKLIGEVSSLFMNVP